MEKCISNLPTPHHSAAIEFLTNCYKEFSPITAVASFFKSWIHRVVSIPQAGKYPLGLETEADGKYKGDERGER